MNTNFFHEFAHDLQTRIESMHLVRDIAPLTALLPRGELFGFASGDVEEKDNVVSLDELTPLVVDVVCTCVNIYISN